MSLTREWVKLGADACQIVAEGGGGATRGIFNQRVSDGCSREITIRVGDAAGRVGVGRDNAVDNAQGNGWGRVNPTPASIGGVGAVVECDSHTV